MRYVHALSEDFHDKFQLGNKGANLVLMTQLGLPVPPGFVLTIDCQKHWAETHQFPEDELKEAVAHLEKEFGKKLGQGLQVSVRSSAPVSMPGMMDTVLNIKDMDRMREAIRTVFESWNSPRAIEYRRLNKISSDLGTSAVVQAMVFGNLDDKSGTGVLFTRDPSTGQKGLFGEYLSQAQGEDVVSGVRTPAAVSSLESAMPEVYKQLEGIAGKLEQHFNDMQDIEFTVESSKLYMLQTRSGKRTGLAAVTIAVDMVNEGVITREEAVLRVTPADIEGMLHKQLKPGSGAKPITKGLNAAPGAVFGKVVFDPDEAVTQSKKGVMVILVRPETSPDDIHGIAASVGVLSQRGGMTSHAAVVTRGMGKPCVCGAEGIEIDLEKRQFKAGNQFIKQGDEITIDGTTGNVYAGRLPLEEMTISPALNELMGWCDGFKRLGVRANADTPEMIKKAKTFGAEGIGLCRTERMFNAPDRLAVIREFILADSPAEKKTAIDHLREVQTKDFAAIFRALEGLPIIIRLLDVPLHEFLPPENEATDPKVKQRVAELHETNPMMGHRGIRLAITSPELYKMQIEAIYTARSQVSANVAIMVPQVIDPAEPLKVKPLLGEQPAKFGVMMETVRACMRAGKLAEAVDFFSFGTNDLTQAVFSFSREDAEKKFLNAYLEQGILKENPFEVLDSKGVGRLMETAIFWARRSKKEIEIGVCGEQGGEPRSVKFLHTTGVDYVSCSPFRVPVARLAAAQAALQERLGS